MAACQLKKTVNWQVDLLCSFSFNVTSGGMVGGIAVSKLKWYHLMLGHRDTCQRLGKFGNQSGA